MKSNSASFPYPVLGEKDDVTPLLVDDDIKFRDPVKTKTDYLFHIDLHQGNREIAELINRGCAEYICEVECRSTFFRKCFKSAEPSIDVILSRKAVRGHVDFNCYIIAKQDIPGYSNSGFHSDYGDCTFDLEKGDLLAIFPAAEYNVDIKHDRLFAMGSFMQIAELPQKEGRPLFDIDGDKILIKLPTDQFNKYKELGGHFSEIIHASIVYNALVYALLNYKELEDSGRLWVDCLKHRILTEPGLGEFDLTDKMEVFNLATELLKNPVDRLLESLKKMNEQPED